jgi:hypothetical protein
MQDGFHGERMAGRCAMRPMTVRRRRVSEPEMTFLHGADTRQVGVPEHAE